MRKLLAFLLAIAIATASSCVISKPTSTPDTSGPKMWGLPAEANDSDTFCIVSIKQPQYCRTVRDVRDFVSSMRATP